jgi:hypothetical protein
VPVHLEGGRAFLVAHHRLSDLGSGSTQPSRRGNAPPLVLRALPTGIGMGVPRRLLELPEQNCQPGFDGGVAGRCGDGGTRGGGRRVALTIRPGQGGCRARRPFRQRKRRRTMWTSLLNLHSTTIREPRPGPTQRGTHTVSAHRGYLVLACRSDQLRDSPIGLAVEVAVEHGHKDPQC